MNRLSLGMLAGLAATVVLSAMMVAKASMGLMPALDPIGMIAAMTGTSTAFAWGMHLMIGVVVWGGAFALTEPHLPGGECWIKGVVFGVCAWLIMMLAMMPMAGAGIFGVRLGLMAPVMTVLMHVVFGAVLGAVYGLLLRRSAVHEA
ncbi:MAG: hypothetical protein COW75_01340 [Rhodobacterales bacterium CG18_big_fil_WC_8_21_14_2_50_71_9]|nr:MAG: hypothetical protein COW75_01340 [Rhodobacterales bacterium CG18_big_fil_WC_8_21_14_2_50_71_9]PIY73509.1 MAG: hypothetical protein COY86_06025 [Rhodobacterales bacterium CG_4_10_14_0_8_um_filter_70_9]